MQQQKPQKPLEGAQLVIMTIALSLATFMQVLDSTIANLGHYLIRGGERHLYSHHRLAGEARR